MNQDLTKMTLEQLRKAVATGGVTGAVLRGRNKGFALEIQTRNVPALLVSTNEGTERVFADPRKVFAMLCEFGILENVVVDLRGWMPEK